MKNFDKQLETIKKLPRQKGLVLAGGKRQLGLFSQNARTKEYFQPEIAIWQDAATGMILGSRVIEAQGNAVIKEALQSLLDAIEAKIPAGVAFGMRQKPKAALPEAVVINDKALADAAQTLLAPLSIPVEFTGEPIEPFEDAFGSMSRMMGATDNPRPPRPFSWELEDESHIPALFTAATLFWQRQSWDYMGSDVPALIEIGANGPSPDVQELYAVPLGNGGMVTGVTFYTRKENFDRAYEFGMQMTEDDEKIAEVIEQLRAEGMPVDDLPPQILEQAIEATMGEEIGLSRSREIAAEAADNNYVIYFDDKEEVDRAYMKWIRKRKISLPRTGIPSFQYIDEGMQPRELNEREVTSLALALNAFSGFLSMHARPLIDYVEPPAPHYHYSESVAINEPVKTTVKVTYPAPGYEDRYREIIAEDDEDGFLAPDDMFMQMMQQLAAVQARAALPESKPKKPTKAGKTMLFRFLVSFKRRKMLKYRIELRGDQTLDDFHNAIQNAFGWEDDHLYSFFLSGRAWDDSSYESPHSGEGRPADKYYLEHLPLAAGHEFIYIFDFGDEHTHKIRLEAIESSGVKPGVAYPTITEA
jgi:Plasmid pRiA4b ORF-3-like protein